MAATTPMICVSLRYADTVTMFDWLIEAFGVEKHWRPRSPKTQKGMSGVSRRTGAQRS